MTGRERPAARARDRVRRHLPIVILASLLTLSLLWLYWPRPGPGPIVLLGRGSEGQSRWAVLAERSGRRACLQVRVDGARRRLMCDRDWDAPTGVNVWHGEPPARPFERFGPPSLLRVTFAGSDRVLLVAVLPGEITRLSLSGPAGPAGPAGPDTPLPVGRLLGTDQAYVLAVVPRASAGEPKAFDAAGRPVFYRFLNP
jgi:hypothetical protein